MPKIITEYDGTEGKISLFACDLLPEEHKRVREEIEKLLGEFEYIDSYSVRAHIIGDYNTVKELEKTGWRFQG